MSATLIAYDPSACNCCACDVLRLERRGRGANYARAGYREFTGATKYFRCVVARGWGFATGYPLFQPSQNEVNCSIKFSFAHPDQGFSGSLDSTVWDFFHGDEDGDGDPFPENALYLIDHHTICADGFYDWGVLDTDSAAYHLATRFDLYNLPYGLPQGEASLINEITEAMFLQEVRDYVRSLAWASVVNGGYPSSEYAFTPGSASFTFTQQQYRWRFRPPPSGTGLRLTWDVFWNPTGGSPELHEAASYQWDRDRTGFDPTDIDTWPVTPWFDLPEPEANGTFDLADLNVICGRDKDPTEPAAVGGYAT
ncbi:MAG: hypothetical protein HZA93_23940 [Verrucomicrobia bacterium]|nr:hypothetical protein [Verrucomicrobiota bacterium]